ncbi:hypothetical protein SAMN05421644_12220 [Allochromatium warmingii]|uniref:Uncharacterized protein n=1 Tax=Allochromatium warmingii TaxID=61595 RepID=A0A1H3G2G0_ALLWA|nr:hypothetical protein SAMN05421644_12220 [Allochromatium warmingii]
MWRETGSRPGLDVTGFGLGANYNRLPLKSRVVSCGILDFAPVILWRDLFSIQALKNQHETRPERFKKRAFTPYRYLKLDA